jgi:hypothetical protein
MSLLTTNNSGINIERFKTMLARNNFYIANFTLHFLIYPLNLSVEECVEVSHLSVEVSKNVSKNVSKFLLDYNVKHLSKCRIYLSKCRRMCRSFYFSFLLQRLTRLDWLFRLFEVLNSNFLSI